MTILPASSFSQDDLITHVETIPVDENSSDKVTETDKDFKPDSSNFRFDLKIDDGSHHTPVHPRFRDEYRLIHDIRRLFRLVDRRSVHGYESIDELAEIGRNLPKNKQTKMIGAAAAGSVVSILSDMTNKQLRKSKLGFIQWKLEKVIFRRNFRYLYANVYNGVTAKGYGLYIPKLKIYYSRYSTKYSMSDNFIFRPTKKFGFRYSLYNGRNIISPFIASTLGSLAVSYDNDQKILISSYYLRKSMSIIIRLLYVDFLERPNCNYFRSEVLLSW